MNQASNEMPEELQESVTRAITLLKDGKIVVYPTDTVYGLGCSIYDEKAVKQVFKVKNRPQSLPVPVLLSNINQIKDIAVNIPDIAWQLAREFWPGGLTLVLYKSPKVPSIVTAGSNTIAVRVPSHPVPIALIEGIKSPIVGTSANLHGQPSPHTVNDVKMQLGEKPDLIIDGGHLPGIESTIVDCTGKVAAVMREGVISRRNIERICEVCG